MEILQNLVSKTLSIIFMDNLRSIIFCDKLADFYKFLETRIPIPLA